MLKPSHLLCSVGADGNHVSVSNRGRVEARLAYKVRIRPDLKFPTHTRLTDLSSRPYQSASAKIEKLVYHLHASHVKVSHAKQLARFANMLTSFGVPAVVAGIPHSSSASSFSPAFSCSLPSDTDLALPNMMRFPRARNPANHIHRQSFHTHYRSLEMRCHSSTSDQVLFGRIYSNSIHAL